MLNLVWTTLSWAIQWLTQYSRSFYFSLTWNRSEWLFSSVQYLSGRDSFHPVALPSSKVCRKGRSMEHCSWVVLWSSSVLCSFHPLPIGQSLCLWLSPAAREAGQCGLIACPPTRRGSLGKQLTDCAAGWPGGFENWYLKLGSRDLSWECGFRYHQSQGKVISNSEVTLWE